MPSSNNILLQDDFSGASINTTLWHYPLWTPVNNPTYLGRTQLRQELPEVSGGAAHLLLNTYNPTGASFYGTEIDTNASFTVGTGLAFEARVKLNGADYPGGMVAGIFGYALLDQSHRDEIDFELLTNDYQMTTNVWNDGSFSSPGVLVSESSHASLAQYHTYRIEITAEESRWFIDGDLVRTESSVVPDAPMSFNLNFWAPDTSWPGAYSQHLNFTTNPAQDVTYSYDVDYVWITRMDSLNGGAGAEILSGTDASEALYGEGGADTLSGLGGNDTLDGGTGLDSMRGGMGNDVYVVDELADRVTESSGQGKDLVRASVSHTLSVNVENLTLTGELGTVARGNALGNVLIGNSGANTLDGRGGNDILTGKGGADTITGGPGNDVFRYTARWEGGDVILDFVSGADRIQVVSANFGNLPLGALSSQRFRANASGLASAASDRFIYETDTGALRFDPDGSGALAAVNIAILHGSPSLTAGDIQIVAA